MRILIMGPPRTGKTTLAAKLGSQVLIIPRSTDTLIHSGLEWSEQSAEIARWFNEPNYIIEGVRVVHSLRKWLTVHPNESTRPFDRLIVLTKPYNLLTHGQQTMALGIQKIWTEVQCELNRRGWMEAVDYGTEGSITVSNTSF